MKQHTVILVLDDDDYRDLQREFAIRQLRRDEHGTHLPDGESNLPGAMIGEIVRDLVDFRDLWHSDYERRRKAP